ncbi:DUF6263 family protein [Carboxylicivirga sp. N1Y90]|uniref:DUF6263 family protein n=1 Tax=Carboxylicivirga fragile TaxID=3417571 RepID=UPI003D337C75|nr:hypothetical protein [Marinilabiliaceae bacterium N1Y90]
MNQVSKITALLLLALLILPSTIQAQLRYNLKVGEMYGLKQESFQDITQNIQGMTQNIKNTIGGDITVTIVSKSKGVYTSTLVFESLLFKMESTMFTIAYDSKDEAQEENMLSKAFDAIVDFEFTMIFDETGEITEVRGSEKLLEKIALSYGKSIDELGMVAESVKTQFSDKSMKQNMSSMLLVYPDEKLKVGTEWTNEVVTAGAMPIVSNYNYVVTSANKSIIELKGTGKMTADDSAGSEQNGMTQNFDLSGDVIVSATIDAKTAWPQSMELNQEMEGSVSIESPQLPVPMEVPMTISSKSTYKAY